ncbi:hypothetical protein [Haloglomus litoreum]|uniref:hypothetical protein n=1 Tax=Haloglomus litoreum TaxID=3034026 RepID=UPI0023E7C842|nr:hypothetical protein [Haloglomus sp. DT116]
MAEHDGKPTADSGVAAREFERRVCQLESTVREANEELFEQLQEQEADLDIRRERLRAMERDLQTVEERVQQLEAELAALREGE